MTKVSKRSTTLELSHHPHARNSLCGGPSVSQWLLDGRCRSSSLSIHSWPYGKFPMWLSHSRRKRLYKYVYPWYSRGWGRRLKQDCSEFKDSLDYIVTDKVSPNLKNGDNNNNNNKGKRRKKKKKMLQLVSGESSLATTLPSLALLLQDLLPRGSLGG